jgi:molybdopterin synthase catalytic subunit
VKVTLRCFAMIRELLGSERLEVELPEGSTLVTLKEHLAKDAPDLLRLPFTAAVNQDYASEDRVLVDGDEVALIPPISGGDPAGERFDFVLHNGVLDPRSLEQQVRRDADGAVVTFAGVSRDHNEGRAVEGLSYEAYDEMAAKVMADLFDEAAEKFEIGRARVAHRLGEVPIGEASVLVVVGSPHRGPAFEACRYLMDRIKERLPIFKKERFAGPDGETHWVGELPKT